jgi:hypothetical protein
MRLNKMDLTASVFDLSFNIIPYCESINTLQYGYGQNNSSGKVLTNGLWVFSNNKDESNICTKLNLNDRKEIISSFFGIKSEGFNNEQRKAFPYTEENYELLYIRDYFESLHLNFTGMKNFLDYAIQNGLEPNDNLKVQEQGYKIPNTEYLSRSEIQKGIKIQEVGNLTLLAHWNFIVNNELLSIPQKYDSKIHISKNNEYHRPPIFEMRIPSITPVDRTPVMEAYKNLK